MNKIKDKLEERYYLIYHPERDVKQVGKMTIYHDKFSGNQDPYIWNKKFLHSFCHITQLKNEKNQINFWVSADKYDNITKLYCDCVFVIDSKHKWALRNSIASNDQIVDNSQAFEHHYKFAYQHPFIKRTRYTLKAHPLWERLNSYNARIDSLCFQFP